ncbi:DUF899 family protein [Polymorphospora rubra]|uniref:DUF899 family protein n=1 Tax=Polymorphospora rubra TaxID=338584 RepID=UPI0033DD1057
MTETIGQLNRAVSGDYRTARAALLAAERELRDAAERVAALRRALPPGPVVAADTPLTALDGTVTSLGELFDGQPTLFTYNLMFDQDWPEPCPMCAMWIDGLDPLAPHLRENTAVAVLAPAAPDRLADLARSRGWQRVPVYSTRPGDLTDQLGLRLPGGDMVPAATVYRRDGERLRVHWHGTADLTDPADPEATPYHAGDGGDSRGLDPICATWSVLDLLPQGRGDWYASHPEEAGGCCHD